MNIQDEMKKAIDAFVHQATEIARRMATDVLQSMFKPKTPQLLQPVASDEKTLLTALDKLEGTMKKEAKHVAKAVKKAVRKATTKAMTRATKKVAKASRPAKKKAKRVAKERKLDAKQKSRTRSKVADTLTVPPEAASAA